MALLSLWTHRRVKKLNLTLRAFLCNPYWGTPVTDTSAPLFTPCVRADHTFVVTARPPGCSKIVNSRTPFQRRGTSKSLRSHVRFWAPKTLDEIWVQSKKSENKQAIHSATIQHDLRTELPKTNPRCYTKCYTWRLLNEKIPTTHGCKLLVLNSLEWRTRRDSNPRPPGP